MSRRVQARVFLGLAALALLALFAPPLINVNRYRSDVANSLSRALGRQVSVGSISLRIFPEPGFSLTNVVVDDDPDFSAEPLLRASDVDASLRLSSLWRGRLEIAKLSLSDPSLNVVRRRDGRWNLESLLERGAHPQAAPTASKPEARPRFPYIEAESGRINLKLGQEKKPYALSDADFALWLATDREWRLRLSARPMRTDDNLSDAGTLRLSGSAGTADRLSNIPLGLRLTLDGAQLGQFTRLIYGRDSGWRGTFHADFRLGGTPADMSVLADAAVDNFHHHDVFGIDGFQLRTHCTARVSSSRQTFEDVACRSKVGDGVMSAAGQGGWSGGEPEYHFKIAAEKVPMSAAMSLARRMKRNFPEDLNADGIVGASFSVDSSEGAPLWDGTGEVLGASLNSDHLRRPISLGLVEFKVTKSEGAAEKGGQEIGVSVGPIQTPLGENTPASTRAWLSPHDYRVLLQGEAQADRLLAVARALNLPVTSDEVSGSARVRLEMKGEWSGATPPEITGTADLQSVGKDAPSLPHPLIIQSGTLLLTPDSWSLKNATFRLDRSRIVFGGWVQRRRGCGTQESASSRPASLGERCDLEFRLTATRISTADLYQVLRSGRSRPWYAFGRGSSSSPLRKLRARGAIIVNDLEWNQVSADHVRADARLEDGVLLLGNLQGHMLGGMQEGELRADFRSASPVYNWHGQVRRLAAGKVAQLLGGPWSGGAAIVSGAVQASGWTAAELKESASGDLQVDWRDSLMGQPSPDGSKQPVRMQSFLGNVQLAAGALKISEGNLRLAKFNYRVSGTASLDGAMNIRLNVIGREPGISPAMAAATGSYEIGGELKKPTVIRVGVQEAASPLRPKSGAPVSAEGSRLEPSRLPGNSQP